MRRLAAKVVTAVRGFLREKFHSKNPSAPYYLTIIVAVVFFALAVKVFAEVTDELLENQLETFDESVTEYVISFRSDAVTSFFVFMTNLGDVMGYVIVSSLVGLFFLLRHRNWLFISQTVFVLILASLSNVLAKKVVNRPRPTIQHLVEVYSLSFPSGHAMSAMAFYGFLIYLVVQSGMSKFARVFFVVLFCLIILSIGVSRIYLGVHFPSDVAAGFAGGLIWVALCVIVFNLIALWRIRKTKKPLDTI